MSEYPIVEAYKHPNRGPSVVVAIRESGTEYHFTSKGARLLATRLVAVVGCEQLDAERKRSEELVGLLRDALGMLSDLHDGKRVCFEDWVTIDGRLRAALEGR